MAGLFFQDRDFRSETAGAEKGEVLCAQREMDPSVRGTQKVMPTSKLIITPPLATLLYAGMLHKLCYSLYNKKLPDIQGPLHNSTSQNVISDLSAKFILYI